MSADKSSKIKLRHTREFVRLIDGVEKQTEGFTSQAFAELISEQVKKAVAVGAFGLGNYKLIS